MTGLTSRPPGEGVGPGLRLLCLLVFFLSTPKVQGQVDTPPAERVRPPATADLQNSGTGRTDRSASPSSAPLRRSGTKAATTSSPRRGEPVEESSAGETTIVRLGHEELPQRLNSLTEGPRSVEQFTQSAPWALGLAALSIVPTIVLMTTCYVRFSVVLGLLRQGLGTPQFPPNSVLTALCLFLTCLVMRPVWEASFNCGVRPWLEAEDSTRRSELTSLAAQAVQPVRDFMSDQIERSGNSDTVWMLVETPTGPAGDADAPAPTSYDQIPLPTLMAAFVMSELKVGVVIGFQILLPFLVIDLVVGLLLSVLGLQNLSPQQLSLPFKLLLFILVDGWTLVVGRLLGSVGH